MKQIVHNSLVVISLIVLAALSACGSIEATNDSQQVTDTASKIADFELPAGYASEFSIEVSGYMLASFRGEDGPSHLYLIQSEKQSDGEELEQMLAQLAPGSSDPNTRLTVIENHTATVRGQEVAVVTSEGVNSENVTYRQLTVGFQGKGGPALLVFTESAEQWNQEMVDAFLQSIQ